MLNWESCIASCASKCENSYGGMGRVGYLYDSMKDQLKWAGLDVKRYIGLISNIGKVLALSDKDYSREKTRAMKMSSDDIKSALISAFGDGK